MLAHLSFFQHSASNENVSLKDSKDGSEKFKPMYEVYFVGIVPDIVMSNSLTRDREAQFVDRIEESQVCRSFIMIWVLIYFYAVHVF